PQWSICAWLSSTHSMSLGSNGNGASLRASSSRPPWYMPQSSSTVCLEVEIMWQEPVTESTAPQNRIFMLWRSPFVQGLQRQLEQPRHQRRSFFHALSLRGVSLAERPRRGGQAAVVQAEGHRRAVVRAAFQ